MKSPFTILILLLSVVVPVAIGQTEPKDVSLKPAYAGLNCLVDSTGVTTYQLDVMLDRSLKHLPTSLQLVNQEPAHYRVIRLSDGSKNDVYPTVVSTTLNNTLTFSVIGNFDPKDVVGFGLLANNTIRVEGEDKKSSTLTKIAVADSCSTPPDKLPKPTEKKEAEVKDLRDFLLKPDQKKEAKLSTDFSIDGSKHNRRYFTNNIDFTPVRIHRYSMGGAVEVIPVYVKFRFSGDKKSPVDTLEFGAKATHFKVFEDDGKLIADGRPRSGPLTGIATTVDARIETDWFFDKQANLVFGARVGLPFNLIQSRVQSLRITPFVGYEGGFRIKSETAINKERRISRPIFGADLFYSPFRKEGKKPVVLEIKYITRVILKQEPAYATDPEGKEFLVGFSRLPRSHVNAKVTFNYGDFLSPFIEYTYGREPGKYVLVNSRYRAGIQFNIDWAK